jgi:hypothetical protein
LTELLPYESSTTIYPNFFFAERHPITLPEFIILVEEKYFWSGIFGITEKRLICEQNLWRMHIDAVTIFLSLVLPMKRRIFHPLQLVQII